MQRQLIKFDEKPNERELLFLKTLLPVLTKPYLDPSSETWVVDFTNHENARKIRDNLVKETKPNNVFFNKYFMGIASFKNVKQHPGMNIIKEQYDYWFAKASEYIKSTEDLQTENNNKRTYDSISTAYYEESTAPVAKKSNTTTSLLKGFACDHDTNRIFSVNETDEVTFVPFNEENFVEVFDKTFNDPIIEKLTNDWLNTSSRQDTENLTDDQPHDLNLSGNDSFGGFRRQ